MPQTASSSVRSFRPGPYALAVGEDLRLVLDGALQPPIAFRAGAEIANLAQASVAEVCAFLRAESGRLHAAGDALDTVGVLPCLWGTPLSLEIVDRVDRGGLADHAPRAPRSRASPRASCRGWACAPGPTEAPRGAPPRSRSPSRATSRRTSGAGGT